MPGKPAARQGDMTAHGGVIVVGAPTVLIGGMPAARVSDMHVCPMLNPGLPPPPHVGGPVMPPGAPMVLISGQPAACVGDMLMCAGPPDTILPPGCPTVLIGSGGGGGAGMSGGGKGRSEGASAGTEVESHYLDVTFVDKGGKPITGVKYTLKGPDGILGDGTLTGRIKRTGLKEGDYEITLKAITGAKWSVKEAKEGEKVKLLAEGAGFEDGADVLFEIWEKDFNKADEVIKTIEGNKISGGKAEAEWVYEYHEDDDEGDVEDKIRGYSAPEYYFIVKIEGAGGKSPILKYKDYLEIELKDEEGKPVANEEYVLYLSNGEVRKGNLDASGYAREKNIPPGKCSVTFPKAGEVAAEGG